jgi:hypothetical protein
MQAAYPDLSGDETCGDHRHDDATFALATALAQASQHPEPTDEQVAWFLVDAAQVVDDFDPVPATWTVTEPQMSDEFGLDYTLTINGIEYVIPESEWETSHPVSLTEWREWHGEDHDDE